ncbi:prolyl 4-hydroxylase 1 isoform X1 [Tanacetum coccineum]
MASAMKIVIFLLTLVTIGMLFGSFSSRVIFSSLAYIRLPWVGGTKLRNAEYKLAIGPICITIMIYPISMLHGDGYGNGNGDRNGPRNVFKRPRNVSQAFPTQREAFPVDMKRFLFSRNVSDAFPGVSRFRNVSGSLLQLAFIRNLEDSYGSSFPSFRRTLGSQNGNQLPPVVSGWGNDKEAAILRIGYVKPEIISWSPRIIVFHNFLSSEECDYLRAVAKPRLKVSTVVDAKTGKVSNSLFVGSHSVNPFPATFGRTVSHHLGDNGSVGGVVVLRVGGFEVVMVVGGGEGWCYSGGVGCEGESGGWINLKGIKSNVRTSSGMFLNHEERKYPVVHAIEKRIATYSQVPIENGELIQVLRYEPNQFYRPHHDYFSDTFNLKRGGQRVATMLMYLTDNVEGGETFFPMAGSEECSCGGKMMKGLCVKPNKGDAVLFWSMGLDGQSDPSSIHGGCEVLSGEKWSATKWMRQKTTS